MMERDITREQEMMEYGEYIYSDTTTLNLTDFLGWFSLGLGAVQVLMPGKMAQLIGMEDSSGSRLMMRLVGARELVSGVGIFSTFKPANWIALRAGGDAMDLTVLGMMAKNADKKRIPFAAGMVAGVMVLDMLCHWMLTNDR